MSNQFPQLYATVQLLKWAVPCAYSCESADPMSTVNSEVEPQRTKSISNRASKIHESRNANTRRSRYFEVRMTCTKVGLTGSSFLCVLIVSTFLPFHAAQLYRKARAPDVPSDLWQPQTAQQFIRSGWHMIPHGKSCRERPRFCKAT